MSSSVVLYAIVIWTVAHVASIWTLHTGHAQSASEQIFTCSNISWLQSKNRILPWSQSILETEFTVLCSVSVSSDMHCYNRHGWLGVKHQLSVCLVGAQLLKDYPSGLWSTRFKVLYKEEFGQEPPANLMDIVQTWTNVLRTEMSVPSGSQSLTIAVIIHSRL